MHLLRSLMFIFLFSFFLIGCRDNQSTEPAGEDFKNALKIPAPDEIVMYEINLRAFSREGNFNGVFARLDSIKALGVNTIWFMPIHPVGKIKSVGQLGSPYSVKDYKGVNPEFGTIDDFKNLIAESHRKGIAVIIDWVANHTSWDNAWIANKTWYTQDGAGNIISPAGTNWQDVADLNYDNGEMRLAMIDAMKYWYADIGVDGFRCDAADMVPFSFWKQAIDSLKKVKGRNIILLAEGRRPDHFTAGFQINYAWDFYSTLKLVFVNGQSASSLYTTHLNEYRTVTNGVKLRFTTNHDETAWDNPPVVLFNGKQGALAASAAAIFMGGIPLIYNGQEVGLSIKLPFFSRSPIDWSINSDMNAVYKKLLSIRNNNKEFIKGSIANYSDQNVVAFVRLFEGKESLVIINTRNSKSVFKVPPSYENALWTELLLNTAFVTNGTITLEPYQFYILRK